MLCFSFSQWLAVIGTFATLRWLTACPRCIAHQITSHHSVLLIIFLQQHFLSCHTQIHRLHLNAITLCADLGLSVKMLMPCSLLGLDDSPAESLVPSEYRWALMQPKSVLRHHVWAGLEEWLCSDGGMSEFAKGWCHPTSVHSTVDTVFYSWTCQTICS